MNRSYCQDVNPIRHLLLILAMFFFLSACTGPGLLDTPVPGRSGLLNTLDRFEKNVHWKNWSFLMEAHYLPDHAKEAREKFGNDLNRWFLADKFTAAISGKRPEEPQYTCILALREKHVSPNFEPHFVVYYRIQGIPCQEELKPSTPIVVEGQMDWGFDVKDRRWVHLRQLGS